MLQSLRSYIPAVIRLPAPAVLTVGTVATFAWLLIHNEIHPIVVYLLQIYLTF